MAKDDTENDVEGSAEPVPIERTETARIPIVGLGASAGGIEAFAQFFDAMPADSGAAFVVVLHLDPTRESQLSSILSRHTPMPVVEIENGMHVAPNHVYVIAPDGELTLNGDTLLLTKPSEPRGHRHPIDVLFASLGEQRQERAVAIVLSGTGMNGTQGLKEIKASGGLILIEDPAAARFDGMPRSAINAGLADRVLSPADMPEIVLHYLRHGYVKAPDSSPAPHEQALISQLLGLLRAHAGFDFRSYKTGTLMRRINRRMSVKNVNQLGGYLDLLRTDSHEAQALAKDLLISVTSFFRDTDAWSALRESVVARLIADKRIDAPIRVWVPACATGEEAYSIAMLLIENAEIAQKQFDLKVFASDILEDNLSVARAGVFPAASVDALPPDRVRRFFEKLDGSYQVRKDLRDLVVFARHDVLRDPPFSRMDLIACRNMLIYIEADAQQRAVELFHFGLRDGGYLFLGRAETAGRNDELFDTVSAKWRIYRRSGQKQHNVVSFPLLGAERAPDRTNVPAVQEPSGRAVEMARRTLLERYAPASVVIDRKGLILYFHGDTSEYLKQPTGEPTRDLLVMTRGRLLTRLRSALQAVNTDRKSATFNTRIRDADGFRLVQITLLPLPPSQQAADCVLVTFEPQPKSLLKSTDEPGARIEPAAPSELEEELRATRAELQGTIEQLESMNEELKASNEEATSSNEELQSVNEELETSKEELQSFNEELQSVNTQLQHKITELDQASNDLANLLSGTEIATVFLDTALRIKWFSPSTKELLELMSSDVGRPIANFALKIADPTLLSDADAVLAKLAPIEVEVSGANGRHFLRRVLPYRTRDDRIAGLVITFIDITERKRAGDAIDEARIYAEAIVSTARQPLVVLDGQLRVKSANRAFYVLFGMRPETTEEHRLYELGQGGWDTPQLRTLLEEVLPHDHHFADIEVPFEQGRRTMVMNARQLHRNGGREELILLAIEEITERKRFAEHQEVLIGELNHRVKNMLMTVQALVMHTARQSTSVGKFRETFEGRLHALARVHDLLVHQEWVAVDIGQIVNEVLAPYRSREANQIAAKGPQLTVDAQVGIALTMILHELGTNAAKYGALSTPAGKLTVAWFQVGEGDAERIRLTWREAGGPPVKGPSRRGFGTRLIERSAAHELDGTAQLEFPEEGVRCELIFAPTAATSRPTPNEEDHGKPH